MTQKTIKETKKEQGKPRKTGQKTFFLRQNFQNLDKKLARNEPDQSQNRPEKYPFSGSAPKKSEKYENNKK